MIDDEQTQPTLDDLRVRIFADGADLASIAAYAGDARIAGFVTNPTHI